MNKTTSRLLLVCLFTALVGLANSVLAQSQQPTLTEKDKTDINASALKAVRQLNHLLNRLTNNLTEDEVDTLISANYRGAFRLFDNAETIIEDDVNPAYTSSEKTEDLPVDMYLNRLILFYSKRGSQLKQATIFFSNLTPTAVQQTGNSISTSVFFKSDFRGKYTPASSSYQPTMRVAEMRAEKTGKLWKVYITHLGFVQPGEGMPQLVNESPAHEEVSSPVLPTHLNTHKKENPPVTSTVHTTPLSTKPTVPVPPSKVITSSMPGAPPPNPRKGKVITNAPPDSLVRPKF